MTEDARVERLQAAAGGGLRGDGWRGATRRKLLLGAVGGLVGGLPLTLRAAGGTHSVMDFGAKGDGVTDDTAALLAAIRASANGTLVIPKTGHFYRVSDTLIVPSCDSFELVLEGDVHLVLPAGDTARCVILGSDIGVVKIHGGGTIDGGAAVGLKPNNTAKSSMAGVFFVHSKQGGLIDVNGLNVRNSFTAAATFLAYEQVSVANYTAAHCGRGHFGTMYAGESIVVLRASTVSIRNLSAEDCSDGAGVGICRNVSCADLRFRNCAIGIDLPANESVSIDRLTVVNPVICGLTSVAWGTQGIQRGAGRLVLRDVNVSSTSGAGVGVAIDSTGSAEISGTLSGLKNGLVVARTFLKQKFTPPRSGTVHFNGSISGCAEEGVLVSSVDNFYFSGRCFGNSRKRPGEGGQILVNASGEGDRVQLLDLTLDPQDVSAAGPVFFQAREPLVGKIVLHGVDRASFLEKSRMPPALTRSLAEA